MGMGQVAFLCMNVSVERESFFEKAFMQKIILRIIAVLMCSAPLHALCANEAVEPLSRAEYILAKIKEGDAVCANAPLTPAVEVDVEKGVKNSAPTSRITERPVVLCAYSEQMKTWQVIELRMQYPVPKDYVTCVKNAPTIDLRKDCVLPYRVVTPGYRVLHLRGYGITRMIFDVYADNASSEKLTVYRTRHLWLDDVALASGDVERIIATAGAKNYTPYHPDLGDPELVDIGTQFLYETIAAVRQELGSDVSDPLTVRSRAFPDRALADVVPWETPLALAVIEQMDDKTFLEDKKLATEAVLIEYALNHERAFRYSQSGANAIGPLQFTDGGGNGTYSAMVRGYPGANIHPQFQEGARDLHNVLKAAIALIDHEVMQFPQIQGLFQENPRLGGAFPVAAYNGGPASAKALYAWFKRRGISVLHEEVALPSSLAMKRTQKCPCKKVIVKGKKKRTVEHIVVNVRNSETPGYVMKYFYLLNYLADRE
ncbi:MAG: hypothetical protein A2845_01435 [Candidatus Lloydbacteria bacterium RIFCSPHIGHO2_01_FULL_49_22]|uniref:Transglycosylase SLT domain-containing protein n=1 Tax=Candidatus Lloydbacteria bacterium RIFCSPHIGHO2_01_FULL_49_22 TaxID=1798658 RepID=A0A1G2CXF0_9BACT|nr:MAG: hypothetical protein A2845_01435 [Candidatus Lloydbacteria bacterium RIFCSPHIGHO2_01_FULL_49_22]OGZ09961.1 MAG: hypothetical protein A3C14_04605 [Candidatus Lloydbacteria bacterium RIFCSPHIGHO2_02_FULL_50_18]